MLANIACLFVPSKKLRFRIRTAILKDKALLAKLPFIYSPNDTLRMLQQGWSISRFGDGELAYMIYKRPIPFQSYDAKLAKRLCQILKSPAKSNVCMERRLLIAIPYPQGWHYTKFYHDDMDGILPLLDFGTKYGDAAITREPAVLGVDEFRKIWEGAKVVFIASSKGRFEMDPRLFDNIKKNAFIDIPPADAFAQYDRILAEARTYPKDHLFLIAAGPTATLLAYDLALDGYRAIDIGHLPNCYKTGFERKTAPEKLPVTKE